MDATTLYQRVVAQSALYGLLVKIYNLEVTLQMTLPASTWLNVLNFTIERRV